MNVDDKIYLCVNLVSPWKIMYKQINNMYCQVSAYSIKKKYKHWKLTQIKIIKIWILAKV